MKKNSLSVLLSEDFEKDFKRLIQLEPSQLEIFTKAFKKEGSVQFDDEVINTFIESNKLDINIFSSIASVSKYLYKFVLENSFERDDIKNELLRIEQRFGIDVNEEKNNLLLNFFEIPKEVQDKYNTSPFINSIIPSISATAAIFNLRTIYKSVGANEIKSFVPIAIIRLSAEDDKENKKSFEFQTDLESLGKLHKFFEEYIAKLKVLEGLSKNINYE
jgi:hypothetical protein